MRVIHRTWAQPAFSMRTESGRLCNVDLKKKKVQGDVGQIWGAAQFGETHNQSLNF